MSEIDDGKFESDKPMPRRYDMPLKEALPMIVAEARLMLRARLRSSHDPRSD